MLAGLLKGPSYFNPDRHPDRAKERLGYVLGRMQEDGVISAAQKDQAAADLPKLVAFDRPHRDSGFDFVDYVGREAKSDGVESLTAQSYTVHSTINAALQRETEAALQEGLALYEIGIRARAISGAGGEYRRRGAETRRRQADRRAGDRTKLASTTMPAWQQALTAVHLPLYDVHWQAAVILDKKGRDPRRSCRRPRRAVDQPV